MQLQYGDYCTCNPKYLIVNPFKINPALKLVYTISNNYVIYKGKSFRDYGSTQMQSICNNLITQSFYSGKTFSDGDLYIYNVATGNVKIDKKTKKKKFGNQTNWISVGVNHHIQFLISELSNVSYF